MVIKYVPSNSCVICDYPITDPICRDCYIRQTMILLNDLKINSMISDYISYRLKNIFHSEKLNDAQCILCKNEDVTMCRYCFSIALIGILRELNFTEDLIKNFTDNQFEGEVSLENESVPGIEMIMK